MTSRREQLIFGFIISVCLIVPFSNDVFIAGFPQMAQYYVGSNVSLVLSIFFLGSALTQPIYGPLSDRFGRKPILMFGLWVYTIASAIVLLSAHSFTSLLVGRFFQAFGVCSATVSVLAMIRDTHTDADKLLKATTTYTAILSAGPALAPLFGSLLTFYWNWHANFVFLFVLGVFYTVAMYFCLHETHIEKNLQAIKPKHFLGNYWNLASNNQFLRLCFLGAVPYAIFFCYFGLSSFFILQQFKVSMIHYGLIIAVNGFIMVTLRFMKWPIQCYSRPTLVRIGNTSILFGGVCMIVMNYFITPSVITFMIPMAIVTFGVTIVRTIAAAAALQLVEKKNGGTASAFYNTSSFFVGAAATALGPLYIHQVYAFGVAIVIASCILIMMQMKIRFGN